MAKAHLIPKEIYAINLFDLWAVSWIYRVLPPNEIHNYQALKKELHARFRISSEQYWKLFRDVKKYMWHSLSDSR